MAPQIRSFAKFLFGLAAVGTVLILSVHFEQGGEHYTLGELWWPAFVAVVGVACLGYARHLEGKTPAPTDPPARDPRGPGSTFAIGFLGIPALHVSALGYLSLGIVALAVLWATGSADVGGWRDAWSVELRMKHAVHFLIAGALTFMAVHAGVEARDAAGITIILGAGYELVERQHRDYLVAKYVHHDSLAKPGYCSIRDILCNVAGASCAAGWVLLCAR